MNIHRSMNHSQKLVIALNAAQFSVPFLDLYINTYKTAYIRTATSICETI